MRKLKLEELGRVDISTFKSVDKKPLVVVLDNIRSAMNVGSFFRTCDAFLIEKVILCGITAVPPNREIHKTAIGATESVEWEYEENIQNAVESLKSSDYEIIGIEQTTDSLPLTDVSIDKGKKYALVFGNEVNGITQEVLPLLNLAVEIPQYGTKHSLNVSVCGGIVLHYFSSNIG